MVESMELVVVVVAAMVEEAVVVMEQVVAMLEQVVAMVERAVEVINAVMMLRMVVVAETFHLSDIVGSFRNFLVKQKMHLKYSTIHLCCIFIY